jgi:hypothetical protein
MADAVDETEKLFARANAAIAEAARLAEESYVRRRSVGEGIRLMCFNARFYPKTVRFYSPADFLFRLGPPEPCQNEINRNGTEEIDPIFAPHADSSD